MYIIMLLVGLGLIVLDADWLVNGASSIARRAGFIIGLTIVGFGTSCPELVVSITGAIEGNADISVGNVVGSNIFNILFILGSSALITPLSLNSMTITDTVMLSASAILLLIWAYTGKKNRIDRWEGAVILLCFALYYALLFKEL